MVNDKNLESIAELTELGCLINGLNFSAEEKAVVTAMSGILSDDENYPVVAGKVMTFVSMSKQNISFVKTLAASDEKTKNLIAGIIYDIVNITKTNVDDMLELLKILKK